MMNKILITVRVPMIDKEYNIFIPVSKKIGVSINLLTKTINELSEGNFPLDKKCILMSNSGLIYGINSTIKESGIRNGDTVVLL